MSKSNHEIKIDESWERLQKVIKNAEEAYNKTSEALQQLGNNGIRKVWIGTNAGLKSFVTSSSVYTTEEFGRGDKCQHDILSKLGVGAGCSNGHFPEYQTQIITDSMVYGIYELKEEGWVRL